MEGFSSKRRIRDDANELGLESLKVKRIKENMLESFNDDWETCTASHELESLMRSLEEEIELASRQPKVVSTSKAGEWLPELGYLLEASDDELGLPSSPNHGVAERTVLDQAEYDLSESNGDLWGFDGEIPSFDSFDLEAVTTENYSTEYVVLDGLFDFSDPNFGFLDVPWRHESLRAK